MNFIVSFLMLNSLMYFELTFVYGVRQESNFVLLHVNFQFSQHYLLKKLFSSHCILGTLSGNFLSCSKRVKDPLEVPEVRCD